MELMYIALLLHKVGKKINEENIKKVADAVGIKVDEAKMKSLVVSLEGIDIEKTIKEASVPVIAAPVAEAKSEHKKEEKSKEDEKKSEEQAAAGLSSLFG